MQSKVKLSTTVILAILAALAVSIGSLATVIYFNLNQRAIAQGLRDQATELKVVATLLERQIGGWAVQVNDMGELVTISAWSIPLFLDNAMIDGIAAVTQSNAVIYGYDTATQTFSSKTTNVLDVGGSALSGITIDPATPVGSALLAGMTFVGNFHLGETTYFVAAHPIVDDAGQTIGALLVGTPRAEIEASASSTLGLILFCGLVVLIVLGSVAIIFARRLMHPLAVLSTVTQKIAAGNMTVDVPYQDWRNEIGILARAVAVFEQNSAEVGRLRETDANRAALEATSRKEMMKRLQASFGRVVEAAVLGDFTQRVENEFPDQELQALAEGINHLLASTDKSLHETSRVLNAIARTDLTVRMTGEHRGAFAALQNDVNEVASNLSKVIKQLRTMAASMKAATQGVVIGTQDLSDRTNRQAASVEEFSATIEAISEGIRNSASLARQASSAAENVEEVAGRAGAGMVVATEAMDRIGAEARRITDVISLIDDIAFQTNLLALNASVEAARAGDAGKGFAVVAVEVRRLAQSAAQSSNEIKSLVERSTAEVAQGGKVVQQLAIQLDDIIAASKQSKVMIAGIADDTANQSESIAQISSAIAVIDRDTQQNSALVEELNAAIGQTEAEATALDMLVDAFSVDPSTSVVTDRSQQRRPVMVS